MLKHLLLYLIIVVFSYGTFAQCPNSLNLIFSDQEQIDEFLTLYPNCTTITTDLTITDDSETNSSISNLNGLENIVKISRRLIIRNNKTLKNLSGFQNLTSIGKDLLIYENDALTSLEAFQNLDSIGKDILIENNSNLVNLKGLEKITQVNEDLMIRNNAALNSLAGLSNITTIDRVLNISENPALARLEGLHNLTSVKFAIEILDNNALIDLIGLRGLTDAKRLITISGNKALLNLNGLQNLDTIGGLKVLNNFTLQNLEGLNNLVSATSLDITGNSELENLEGLDNLIVINNTLSIKNNDKITTLDGLQNLTLIELHLKIEENDSLTSLKGLDKLDSLNQITISLNNMLQNLNGLENIIAINSGIVIDRNYALINLQGLQNLTSVGNIKISYNSALLSLEGLDGLTNISGDLNIRRNLSLTNLAGLESITEIHGDLIVAENYSLVNLKGLENLKTIRGGLTVIYNVSQINMEGLQNLTNIQGDLDILLNDELVDLSGLENLTSVEGGITIRENYELCSIDALENITRIRDELEIVSNNRLKLCYALCNIITLNILDLSKIDVLGNGTVCNNIDRVIQGCSNLTKVQSYLYFDANQNKVRDVDEPNSAVALTDLLPGNVKIVPNYTTGLAQHYVTPGSYTFSVNPNNLTDWILTTDSVLQTTILASDTCVLVEFGVYPNKLVSRMFSYINSSNNRCNDTISFRIGTHNTGTTFTDGILWFGVDSLIQAIEYVDIPDTIIQPDQYGWFFENLPPGRQIKKIMKLVMPGPHNFEFGDYLNYSSYSDFSDTTGIYSTSIVNYNAVLRCSYDPNDKLVSPQRFCDYTLYEDTLVYTIRFQNTGNDYAEDVVIRDTLDKNLDLNTFPLLSSSHPNVLNTSLMEENRLATFEFKNIILPDSTTNLEGSQGYVSYMILPKDGLPENTIIKNSSGIYFDSNPPIFTNTVSNVLVNELPNTTWCRDVDMDGLGNAMDVAESCEQPMGYVSDCSDSDDTILSIDDYKLSSKVSIYPNPSSGNFQIMFDETSFKNTKFNIYNSTGVEVVAQNEINRKNQFYDYQHLANGVYYINIHLNEENIIRKKLLVLK